MPGWEFNKIQYQKLITFNRNHKFQLLVFLVISYKLTEKKNYLEVYSSYMYMNRNLAGQVQKQIIGQERLAQLPYPHSYFTTSQCV